MAVLTTLAIGAAAVAQEDRIQDLLQRRSVTPESTLEWFCVGAEIVEAQFEVDGAAALATASALWQQAASVDVPGLPAAMAAIAEFACCRVEGPTAAQAWSERASDLPGDAPASLRAYYHFSRARSLCYAGRHADELKHSIPGQAAADEIGDPVLRLRAAQITLHATPQRSVTSLKRILDDALAGPRAEDVAACRPWILLDEYVQQTQNDTFEAAEPLLIRAEQLAREAGNPRVLATVCAFRGNRFADSDPQHALEHYEQACRLLRQIGDRRELAATLDIRAWLLIRRGDLDQGEQILDEASALVEGRGLVGVERELLRSQLELAVRRRDGDKAAELASLLDVHSAAAAESDKRSREVRASLVAAEAERQHAEAELEAAELAMAQHVRRTETIGAIAAMLFLGALVGISWRSRRKLLGVNRRLAEEVERVEVARGVQAKLEERLRQIERTQGLGTMAAGIAHDFNNLLTGILGNAELIERAGGGAEVGVRAARIRASGQQAARMCRHLQVYAGATPIQVEPIDLTELVRGLLPVLRTAVGDAVDVQVMVHRDRIGALGDRTELEQVLLNLVVNARDAKARKVEIRVTTAPTPGAATSTADDIACIEVVDDGEGMTPEIADRVFDPFFTTRFPGRGLGLAVVSGIVQRHGGSISVQSSPGQGSTFRVQLSGVAAPERRAEPVVVLPARVVATTSLAAVLVVDDEDAVRRVLVGLLQYLGCEAMAFADGEAFLAALAVVPAERPVLLFVDLSMPGMEGREVVRRARQLRPQARIVVMSGHSQAHVEQLIQDIEPDRVLAKPFQLDSLSPLLNDLLPPANAEAVHA